MSLILKFECYSSLTMYMHDFVQSESWKQITLQDCGFESRNPAIQIKVLPNGALDIINIGGKFISDVKLSPQQKNYIINIDKSSCLPERYKTPTSHFKPKLVTNYEDEVYWALTSKMRGYTVGFKYAFHGRYIKDSWKKILRGWYYRYGDISSEEDDFEVEDDDEDDWNYDSDEGLEVESDYDDNMSEDYVTSDEGISDQESGSTSNEDETDKKDKKPMVTIDMKGDVKVAQSDILISAPIMVQNILHSIKTKYTLNMIVIEYFYCKCNYCTVKYIGEDMILIEMFVINNDCEPNIPISTLILFNSVNCNGVDLKLHCDEGVYDSGVNFYTDTTNTTKGVIFSSPQNDDPNSYGRALEDGDIVPDLLLTEEALANMSKFISNMVDKSVNWYDYERFKNAVINV